jgi:hypothetical protein
MPPSRRMESQKFSEVARAPSVNVTRYRSKTFSTRSIGNFFEVAPSARTEQRERQRSAALTARRGPHGFFCV